MRKNPRDVPPKNAGEVSEEARHLARGAALPHLARQLPGAKMRAAEKPQQMIRRLPAPVVARRRPRPGRKARHISSVARTGKWSEGYTPFLELRMISDSDPLRSGVA